MTPDDIITVILEYAEKSESDADAVHMDGTRVVALNVYLKACHDEEAMRRRDNLMIAAALRFVAESAAKRLARSRFEDAPTPAEPMRLSFVTKDGE